MGSKAAVSWPLAVRPSVAGVRFGTKSEAPGSKKGEVGVDAPLVEPAWSMLSDIVGWFGYRNVGGVHVFKVYASKGDATSGDLQKIAQCEAVTAVTGPSFAPEKGRNGTVCVSQLMLSMLPIWLALNTHWMPQVSTAVLNDCLALVTYLDWDLFKAPSQIFASRPR